MENIRVLIVDDAGLVREGLRAVLDRVQGLEIVGEAGDGREALGLLEEHQPHVVLMDVQMPVMDGLEATRLIKNRSPGVKVIVMTSDDTYQAGALAAGADAFLTKGCSLRELLEAIT